MNKVLIVDNDKELIDNLSKALKSNGFSTIAASGGNEAVEFFKKEMPDAVLLDIKMSKMDGINMLHEFKTIDSGIPIIILAGQADIPTAVKTIKLGAYDFIAKPIDFDNLVIILKRAVERHELEDKLKRLHFAAERQLEWLLGRSPSIKNIIKQIHQVAQSDFSVIIQGETGVGKSIVAHAIHDLSKRVKSPFIPVDIGAMPETLIESELFGHTKGAFTGAEKDKKGFFEISNGGTILLDDLENISPYMQSKLLRVIEERKVYPVGSTMPVEIDVRIIAAINKDIGQEVKEKRFRDDLFFRLGEFVITIPPLRERHEDILFLSKRFFKEAVEELNKEVWKITEDAEDLLKRYPWTGNIRELKNVIRRSVLTSADGIIRQENLEFLIGDRDKDLGRLPLMPLKEVSAIAVRDAEKIAIKHAMEQTKGNKTKAASMLEIDYKTLLKKIKEYGL